MKRINNFFYYATIGIVMIIFLYIFFINIYKLVLDKNLLSIIISFLFILIIALLIKLKESKILESKIFYVFFWIIMVTLTFIIGLNTRVTLEKTWDYGVLIKSAFGEINGIKAPIYYFGRFPNNVPLLIVEIFLGKICKLYNPNITIYGFHTATILLNSFIIATHILIFNLLVKNIISVKAERVSIILSILFFPLYFYAAYLYTDTIACLLMLISFYAFLKYSTTTGNKKILYLVITLFFVGIGFKFKATNIFLYIAILMNLFFEKKYKSVLIMIIGIIPTILLLSFIINKLYPISDKEYDRYKFPYTHWVMMSMNPKTSGNYLTEDVVFTMGFDNYQDKETATTQLLKERLKTYTFSSFMKKTFITKNLIVWADPTIAIDNYLSRKPYHKNILTEFVTYSGKHHKKMLYYLRGIYLVIIVGMLLSAVFIIKKSNSYIYIAQIAIVGIYIFELFWEIHARYIYNFVPLMMITSCYGYNELFKCIYKENKEDNQKEQQENKKGTKNESEKQIKRKKIISHDKK